MDKRGIIISFKQKIHEQEEQLFGITLFFQSLSVVWVNSEQIVKMNKNHYESIMKRGKKFIAKAKQLLNEATEDPNKIGLLQQFEFPPSRGIPIVDKFAEKVKILVETYNELFPGRSKEDPLTEEEILHITEVAANKLE